MGNPTFPARAVDFANYSAIPTPDQVRCWIDQGYTKAIIGTSYPRDNGPNANPRYTYIADQQIAVCEANGVDVEEYQFVGRYRATPRRWWLDVELNETVGDIRAAVLHGKPYGIYTRKGIWDTFDWNIVAEFPDLKLWDASYGNPLADFRPYGGWTSRAMHQWHDSTTLCGINVDLNIVEQEEDMDAPTKGEFQALAALVVKQGQEIEQLKGYAWRDALRINDLQDHQHSVIGDETGPPQ